MSTFTSAYVYYWNKVFPNLELKFPPAFDGRIILYPTFSNLRDYLSWRQVDCHINNLYNTTFWALVLIGKLSRDEAHKRLKGTFSKDKNEILYTEFKINYNTIEDIYKRGTILLRKQTLKKNDMIIDENEDSIKLTDNILLSNTTYYNLLSDVYEKNIFLSHEDMIKDEFWIKYDLEKY